MGQLVAAIENPAIQYMHEWEEGDLLIWDNTSVMHRGMGGYKDYPRLLFRTQAFITPQ
jgi:alpha-ketoglutarate-dependent taurine dioxygenase